MENIKNLTNWLTEWMNEWLIIYQTNQLHETESSGPYLSKKFSGV
jgi:hypothetical protein